MLSDCNHCRSTHSTRTPCTLRKSVYQSTNAERAAWQGVKHDLRAPAAIGQCQLQQYDDFELLWLGHRHKLSISKTSACWSLQDVQQGLLPCDAGLLRDRAEAIITLGRLRGKFDALRILNSSRSVLTYDAEDFQATVTRLLQLLPNVDRTQLLLNTAADMHLQPEVIALQFQELDMHFRTMLGSHITAKPFNYLLKRLRSEPGSSGAGVQQVAGHHHEKQPGPQDTAASAFQQVLQTSHGLSQQLHSLVAVLGPEVAHAALQTTPQLIDVPQQQVQANLQWLQQQLRLSPIAAMLLAVRCGEVLLLPCSQLSQNYTNLRYLLSQLLGFRVQQIGTAIYNAPQLLVADSHQCASNWHQLQQLARRRLAWLDEISNARAPLVSTVLCAQPVQLVMVQYAAETGDLRGKGLAQLLQMDYVDFITACPGFRTWRAVAPGRWTYFAGTSGMGDSSRNSSSDKAAGLAGRSDDAEHGRWFGDDNSSNTTAIHQQVFSRDKLGRPVLVAVGDLGAFDVLA